MEQQNTVEHQCFCQPSQIKNFQNDFIKCVNCQEIFHNKCYNRTPLDDPDDFYCISCRLNRADPFLSIKKFITEPIIMKPDGFQSFKIQIQPTEYETLISQQNRYKLVIYCMKVRIDTKGSKLKQQIYGWPSDNICIRLNDQSIHFQIQCFAQINPDIINNPDKKLNIIQYKLPEALKDQIIIGLGIAKYYSYDQIAIKLIEMQSKNDGNNIIWDERYYQGTKDGCSKSIILKDHISGHKINIPMRGKNCDHWNVIDLENYLQLYSTLSQIDRWICPICQNKIYWTDIQIDFYLYGILLTLEIKYKDQAKKFQQISQISIFQDVQGKLIYEEDLKIQENLIEKDIEGQLPNSDNQQIIKSDKEFINKYVNTTWIEKMKNLYQVEYQINSDPYFYRSYFSQMKKNKYMEQFNIFDAIIFINKIDISLHEQLVKPVLIDNQEQKNTKEIFNIISNTKHLNFFSYFVINFSKNINQLIQICCISISQNKQIIILDNKHEIGQISQLDQLIYILASITDILMIPENNQYYELFIGYKYYKTHGVVLGYLLLQICRQFDFRSNMQIAKIIFNVVQIFPELKYVENQTVQLQKERAMNSIPFIHQMMSLNKEDIEESWVPLLQLLYSNAQNKIDKSNFELVQKVKLFSQFLYSLVYLTFKDGYQEKKDLEKCFKFIFTKWDENNYCQGILETEYFLQENNLEFLQYFL